MLDVFDLPGGGVLQLAAADETGERVSAAIVPLCGGTSPAAIPSTIRTGPPSMPT